MGVFSPISVWVGAPSGPVAQTCCRSVLYLRRGNSIRLNITLTNSAM